MQKIVPVKCPKCNNKESFYRYGKDKDGYQKYLCRKCNHQFAPDRPNSKKLKNYPRCPVCGKATFLHHDYDYYSNYRCCDKKCNHSMFCIGKNSFRNIAQILRIINNVKVSHTTISNWCKKFTPFFNNIALELIPMLNFDSDEWHADETVVKISGKKCYIWFIEHKRTVPLCWTKEPSPCVGMCFLAQKPLVAVFDKILAGARYLLLSYHFTIVYDKYFCFVFLYFFHNRF